MSSPSEVPPHIVAKLPDLLREANTKDQFKRIQCVWLKFKLGLPTHEIATTLGWNRSSVKRVFLDLQREGESALMIATRGGRHHELITWEQERSLVESFREQAMQAKLVVVEDIKRAYEQIVGKRVPKSTVYRMLDRHGWRKLIPGSVHPKGDKAAQELFKKNSSEDSAERA